MSWLNNPSFLTFGGEPITGRIPTQTVIVGQNQQLTVEQIGGVRHAYKQFCDNRALSITPFAAHQLLLPDGTVVRMVSSHGRDTVTVWPTGTSSIEVFGRTFFGIRASNTYKTGFTPPDGSLTGVWRGYDIPESDPPSSLKSLNLPNGNPGHITWVCKKASIDGVPIVLSWRGPNYRYGRCRDWEWPYGNWSFGHPQVFGHRFSDTGLLWINGLCLTHLPSQVWKIIAAALYFPEPVDDPERIVLRVLTDSIGSFSGLTEIPRLAFYDIERPGSSPVETRLTIEALLKNPELAISGFRQVPNLPYGNKLLQRPHFNVSGTKVATITFNDLPASYGYNGEIYASSEKSIVGITIDALTCAVIRFFEPVTSHQASSTATATTTYGGMDFTYYDSASGTYVTQGKYASGHSTTFSGSSSGAGQQLLAVDFVGDIPAAVYSEILATSEWSSGATYAVESQSYDKNRPLTSSASTTKTTAYAVKHTLRGYLFTSEVFSETYAGSGHVTFASGAVSFGGDISLDVFAVGMLEDPVIGRGVRPDPSYPLTATGKNPRYSYKFFRFSDDGTGTGSVVRTDILPGKVCGYFSPGTTSDTTGESPPLGNSYVALAVGASTGTITSTTNETVNYQAHQIEELPTFPNFQHVAVSPDAKFSYFGFGHHHESMEQFVLDKKLSDVPAYASGTFATILTPFFNGSSKL